jgi:hypothetical protein
MDSSHQKMLDKLNSLNGDDFRKQYFSDQVSAHKDAVSLFERYGKVGDNAKLKDWAATTLWAGLPLIPVALAFYGGGIGLESIARGTLPLALFGASGYATLMGRLAMPSLLAQAAAPWIGAVRMGRWPSSHPSLRSMWP